MNVYNLLSSLNGDNLQVGTYPAIASGNESRVVYRDKTFVFKFENYVKGFNVPDAITVDGDGSVRSKVLGKPVSQEAKEPETVETKLNPGSYSAQASGHTSRVIHAGKAFTFKFETGVRGLNLNDTVYVNDDGSVKSELLGAEVK